MSENSVKLIHNLLSAQSVREIDAWIAKYPSEQQQSAVMAALMVAQEEHGYLTPELMDAVAEYLNMPPIAVYEVASFYTMYKHSPQGRNIINVCTNISCELRGSDQIVQHLEAALDIKLGETTQDGRFTLCAVECLGACVNAPMMQINKNDHENLTPESLGDILEQYA